MKRTILKLFLLVTLVGAGCVAYGLFIEPKMLKVREFEFVSEKYKGSPVRIGVITDIHIGGLHVPAKRVQTLVKNMNALEPDFILLPGDFISGHDPSENRSNKFNRKIAEGITYFEGLEAPGFATIGNHDTWWNQSKVRALLEKADVTVLENEAYLLDQICLVGLADYQTSEPDRTSFDVCPSNLPPLVFTHSPQAYESFRGDTVLAVAGHTHGGQVNLPFYGRRVNSTSLGPEHSYGFSKLGGVDVFVSAGVGTSILPVRFRAPPEIVVITLRAQE